MSTLFPYTTLFRSYGENILCEPLELKGVTKLQDKIMLKFRHAGSGIYIKGKKLNALRVFVDEKEIKGITTKVEGNVLTLTSPLFVMQSNIKIRFDMEPYCEVNLYNSAHLPAKPFCITNIINHQSY